MNMKSIKYLSIKYLSRDNKLTVSVLNIVKIAILSTYILNTIEYLSREWYLELIT